MAKEEPFNITDGKNRYRPCPECGMAEGMGLVQREGRLHVLCVACQFLGPGVPNPRPCWQTEKKAFDYWNALPRWHRTDHEFQLDEHQELSEFFIENASVRVQRLDDTTIEVLIDPHILPRVMVKTGIGKQGWFFNVDEWAVGGQMFSVKRPRKATAKRAHRFRLDHRQEFDEVYLAEASVHIERMDETAFWMGIEAEGLPRLMVNTGVERGQWYFNVEEDEKDGKRFTVQRPRRGSSPAGKPMKRERRRS